MDRSEGDRKEVTYIYKMKDILLLIIEKIAILHTA